MPGELSPGTVGRRTIPEGGEKKLRDRIHKESKAMDKYGNLPYSFSKPKKNKRQSIFECENCGNIIQAPVNTVMIICSNCKNAVEVKELKYE